MSKARRGAVAPAGAARAAEGEDVLDPRNKRRGPDPHRAMSEDDVGDASRFSRGRYGPPGDERTEDRQPSQKAEEGAAVHQAAPRSGWEYGVGRSSRRGTPA